MPRLIPTIRPYRASAPTRPNWTVGLVGPTPVWIAAVAVFTLALTLKEHLFLLVLTGVGAIRLLLSARGKHVASAVAFGTTAVFLLGPHVWAQVTTAQYNNQRTGATLNEERLTSRNVRVDRFGKVFSNPVDGDVYAQPLFLPDLKIPGKGRHNVVFVMTEHDSVYALDADHLADPLWRISFINPEKHVTTVPPIDLRCPFIRPEVGITPTPVIDPKTATLYLIARTKEGTQYVQRLHALDVSTGAEKFGGPIVIGASLVGRVHGANATVQFDALRENPRAALLLVNGLIYISWASSCDVGPYYGWVMAYDARTLLQKAVFNSALDGEGAGIWQGGAGPAADKKGNVFLVTGNGDFDAYQGGRNYGQSVLKLALTREALRVSDYFTPFNFAKLNREDADLGSSGPLLLPDQRGPHAHLLLIAGKGEGPIYVIDRDRMGKYREVANTHAVQIVPGVKDCFGAPAYWNQNIYYVCEEDALKEFRVERGNLSPQPIAQGSKKFSGAGVIPVVSADGRKNGILWLIEMPSHFTRDSPAILHAFDATDVTKELYNSEENNSRDRAGIALRFTVPTIVNGKVYIGARREVDVYGPLPSSATP